LNCFDVLPITFKQYGHNPIILHVACALQNTRKPMRPQGDLIETHNAPSTLRVWSLLVDILSCVLKSLDTHNFEPQIT